MFEYRSETGNPNSNYVVWEHLSPYSETYAETGANGGIYYPEVAELDPELSNVGMNNPFATNQPNNSVSPGTRWGDPFGGFSCRVDGMEVPCSMMAQVLRSGAGSIDVGHSSPYALSVMNIFVSPGYWRSREIRPPTNPNRQPPKLIPKGTPTPNYPDEMLRIYEYTWIPELVVIPSALLFGEDSLGDFLRRIRERMREIPIETPQVKTNTKITRRPFQFLGENCIAQTLPSGNVSKRPWYDSTPGHDGVHAYVPKAGRETKIPVTSLPAMQGTLKWVRDQGGKENWKRLDILLDEKINGEAYYLVLKDFVSISSALGGNKISARNIRISGGMSLGQVLGDNGAFQGLHVTLVLAAHYDQYTLNVQNQVNSDQSWIMNASTDPNSPFKCPELYFK